MRVFPSFAYFQLPFCISANVRASRLPTVASGSQARHAPDEIKQASTYAIYSVTVTLLIKDKSLCECSHHSPTCKCPFCISANVRASHLPTVASGSQARHAPDEIKQAITYATNSVTVALLIKYDIPTEL